MSKAFKDSEKGAWTVVRVIVGLAAILFTLFGFIIKQPCDIDQIYLWCRLHPMSVFDYIGIILFYAGCFMLTGLWKNMFTLWEEENTAKWNWIIFFGTVAGVILIWV